MSDPRAPNGHSAFLHEAVAALAVQRPDRPAVVFDGGQWSYADLQRRAGAIAGRLRRVGAGPEVLVGLCVDRSPAAIAAMLGVLGADAAFLPLDPAYPPERLRFMLEDARPAVVLVDAASADALPPHDGQTLAVEDLLADPVMADVASAATAETLAYVIYTSGSTGRPKGVMVPHRGIVNLALAQIRAFEIEAASRVLQFASLSFDAAVAEIAATLCAAASLHIAPRERLLPVEPLASLLRERKITHATLPPSLLATLPNDALPPEMTLILAGEPSGAALVARLAPGRRLLNAYGPTEATVCATIGACLADGSTPSIGRPIAGVEVTIEDAAGQPAPPGSAGEILIGGIGVARGYLGRPELTAERFVTMGGRRLYRTGDLGAWRIDGALEFLGRVDRQIKLHGYRIEPGEIEAVLGTHPQVAAVAVLARGEGVEAKLIAYVVGAPGRRPDAASLRQHLALRLPPWMIPAAFLVLDALPLSPNGKIDRNRLPDPAHLARPIGAPFLAPRDSLELLLATACREVLGIDRVGVRDDFFQLGGDSLAAARVAARVEAATERRLSLAAFTRGATIERLALSLREAGGAVRWSPLVPLATEATGPPLLLVHPAGGTVLAYAELGQALAGAMPVYGLQAQGMEPSQAPLDQVEQMAEAYIGAARRELRPEAWRLAGWSFGAVVAFEMARQLQAAGETVATPIALDAPARHTPPPAAEADIIQRVIRMYGEMLALQPASGGGNEEAPDRLERMVDAAVASGIFPADFGAAPARRLAAVIAGCFRAGEAYQAGPAPLHVTLIRAADNPIRVDDDRLGWGALAERGVNLKFVPGGHTTMLRAPCVAGLAAAIRACILPHSQMDP